jgi:hypothetical protein
MLNWENVPSDNRLTVLRAKVPGGWLVFTRWGSDEAMRQLSSCLTLAAMLVVTSTADAQTPTRPAPTVRPAVDGVLAAFEQHRLVGLGDMHNMAQQEDFFVTLIRDPRFVKEVGNVVVEFGTATHQAILDRYVNGGDVSFAELRSVWSDVVGWVPTVTGLGYVNFFVQVRTINLSLPPEQRVRVWLGEPVIDWSKVKTREDVMPFMSQRDSNPAAIIKREILAKGKKALVIYGAGHFDMPDMPVEFRVRSLQTLVEEDYPDAFFIVLPYWGFVEKACSVAFEQTYRDWPTPAMAFPVRGSTIEDALSKRGCHASTPSNPVINLPNKTAAELAEIRAKVAIAEEHMLSGMNGDALLYLGPAATLTRTPQEPSIYLDAAYRAEINRRNQIRGFQLLPNAIPFEPNTVSPRPLRP